MPTLTKPDDIRNLIIGINDYQGEVYTKYALLFSMHTAQRQGSIISAEWSEIDFDNAIWNIPAEKMRIPTQRMNGIFFVCKISGKRGLRHVVEKIVEKNLCRKHGEKWEKCRSSHHGKHIAEIGRKSHFDVFHRILERLASFNDSVFQHFQTFIQQNYVGGFFRDINGVVD